MRLLAPLAVTVERIIIHRLIDVSLYTTITLVQAAQQVEVDVRLEEGLALARASRAPLYVGRSILNMMGVDVAEAALEEDAQRQFQQRPAVRVGAAEVPIPAPIPLTATVQQQVDNVLTQLRADVCAVDVVLMHRSGELVAAQGSADTATLVQYCKALQVAAENAHDARELHRYRLLLTDVLFTPDAWVLYWSWSDWVLQISGLPDEETPLDAETALTRLKQTAQDLAGWLQGSAKSV